MKSCVHKESIRLLAFRVSVITSRSSVKLEERPVKG